MSLKSASAKHEFEFSNGRGDSVTGNSLSTSASSVGLEADDGSIDEEFVRAVSDTGPSLKYEMENAVRLMHQEFLIEQHFVCDTNRRMGPPASVPNIAQTSITDALADAYADRFRLPALENKNSDTLDMLTFWTKLDGFSPGDFPMEGLAPELQRWLQGTPATFSGHIQPGCTLLTVDCLLPLGNATQMRTGGIHALAESILAGPLVGLGILTHAGFETARFQSLNVRENILLQNKCGDFVLSLCFRRQSSVLLYSGDARRCHRGNGV